MGNLFFVRPAARCACCAARGPCTTPAMGVLRLCWPLLAAGLTRGAGGRGVLVNGQRLPCLFLLVLRRANASDAIQTPCCAWLCAPPGASPSLDVLGPAGPCQRCCPRHGAQREPYIRPWGASLGAKLLFFVPEFR